ncbi:hypothetical protein, partial [Burkholderia vietnamiensis]|uniref:hypothetical protein n=1 Tax=Burkholderia vietnamiensis TaxID=60552 RepID=UPI0030C83DC1
MIGLNRKARNAISAKFVGKCTQRTKPAGFDECCPGEGWRDNPRFTWNSEAETKRPWSATALAVIRAGDLLFGELARFHGVTPRLDDNVTPEISTLKSAIF